MIVAVSICRAVELLAFSHFLLWLPAVSHCPFQFQGIAASLSPSLIVARCLSLSIQSHGVATCLSLSLIVARFLLLLLLVPFSCSKSLTVPYSCWLSLTVYSSSIELLHFSFSFSHCYCLSLNVSPVQRSFYMIFTVSYCGWLSLRDSVRAMELLHVSQVFPHCLFKFQGVAACL